MSSEPPLTLFEKVWRRHVVVEPEGPNLPALLYVDLHLVHEVTSPQAFAELERRGLRVRRADRTLATMDHSTPTRPGSGRDELRLIDPEAAAQLSKLAENCRAHDVPLLPLGDPRQGIVHVIGPELGLTQPGCTVVCGDSHTSTHGAFGALAFGIGSTEVGHVLATQCLLQEQPGTMNIRIDGELGHAVTAKDLILSVIHRLGVGVGTGFVIEYTGSAIRSLEMEGRMTVCNMSIEAGARAGLVSPDQTTFDYLEGRPLAPSSKDWPQAVEAWKALATDPGARFDRVIELGADEMEPMITWGTNPGMAIPITGRVPQLAELAAQNRPSAERAFDYMQVRPGEQLAGRTIDVVFLGSCTNSRLSDLEAAARLLDGRQIAGSTRMIVVPGSQQVKREAEDRGLHEVFRAAGADWRDAGCSMCLAMNQDRLLPGQLAVSTSNRNFEGRQGPGGRTVLASPLTAAASAVAGRIADPREIM